MCFSCFNSVNAQIKWDLSAGGTLTISGTGDMNNHPWSSQSSKIRNVIINNGVTSIGWYAFENCTALTSITIPESVTSIGNCAFADCSGLKSIKIPESVTSIGDHAFENCKSLTSITIPKLVNSIEYSTFKGCTNLTSVSIGYVQRIGDYAFADCSKIKEIYSWNSYPPEFFAPSHLAMEYAYFLNLNILHIKVFVPEGAAGRYKYAFGWMDFSHIYEMTYSPVLSEAEPITVSDGTPTLKKGYYKESTVTYVREGEAISKDNYASFCLPFAVDPVDVQFKAVYVPVGIALYNTEANTLRLGFYKFDDIIPAGTPFFALLAVDDKVEIKNALPVNIDSSSPTVKTNVVRTFNYSDVSGIMNENNDYAINFSGTYNQISPANAYTFNTDGSIGASANVAPFRAYVVLAKNNTNAKIITNFDEDAETTGIKELLIANGKSPVYDLNGRVVNEKVLKSGIYIKNGKKYVK